MKQNYITKSSKLFSVIIALLLFSTVFSQQSVSIVTISDNVNWTINFANSGGSVLTWVAIGDGLPVDIVGVGNNPSFDFSTNRDNDPITVTITSSDNFDFATVLLAPGREIESVDMANMNNLKILELPSNNLKTIDVSANTRLTRLELNNNSLSEIDISKNVDLEEFDASFNELTSVNVAGAPNMEFIDVSNNNLTTIDLSQSTELAQINLDFNLLRATAIDQVIIDVESYGTGGFGHILSFRGNPEDFSLNSYQSLIDLINRGWIVRFSGRYDFGDAPDSYGTSFLSGGAIHMNNYDDDELRLGVVLDYELNGFMGPDADGDDLNDLDDEDGVAMGELEGITTLTTNWEVDVQITNNYSEITYLHAWIDLDGSGTFDADEYSTLNIPAGAGQESYTLNWDIIELGADIVDGQTYARFRVSKDKDLGAGDPKGFTDGGEVEDYVLNIVGYTRIPDANFEQALIDQGIDKDFNVNGQVANSDIRNILELNLDYIEINDLTGIEGFQRLLNLNVNGCQISNLDVTKNTELEYLDCSENLFNKLDLSNNKKLKTLVCGGMPIMGSGLNELILDGAISLEYIYLGYNPGLGQLDVSSNLNLTDLLAPANFFNELDLSNNINLVNLDVSGGYEHGPGDFENGSLTSLDLTKNTNLANVNCEKNQINNLKLNSNIKVLNCSNNKLTELNLLNLTNLESLTCGINPITTLDLNANLNLEYLNCSDGVLEELIIDQAISLERVICSNNYLKDLDLSNNPNTSQLDVGKNRLESLNLANGNNKILSILDARNNIDLTCISVDNPQEASEGTGSYSSWNLDMNVQFTKNCQQAFGDDDNDGVINSEDACPHTPASESVNSNGCSTSQLDTDNDGVNDDKDVCPNTPAGETVDANGCSTSQLDSDNDGVTDNNDQCLDTSSGETVNSNGCSTSQLDTDDDGVSDDKDNCPSTPSGESVDSNGCSDSQLDDDNDGVMNDVDRCPETAVGSVVDDEGCSASQTLGIEDEKLDKSIKFYPNPVSNNLLIQTQTIRIEKVEIYSVLGKKIDVITSDFEHISTDRLSRGVYLVRIYSEKGTTSRKLIKQ